MERPKLSGGIRLFQVNGITVFLHWSWFIIALYDLRNRFALGHENNPYNFPGWHVAEYLSVFVIVLMHEFGHALACRSVGGAANRIMLWPLGGVAFVSPPPRPGAVLWSIAAGPLVNVALLPITFGAAYALRASSFASQDSLVFADAVVRLNLLLLLFNLLPIYPLDGGQILQSLLWFVMGRVWSLRVAAVIGLLGAAAIVILGLEIGNTWFIVLAGFGAWQCVRGLQAASALGKFAKLPRHAEFRCPACGKSPVKGNFWRCSCGTAFDTFETGFACPQCGQGFQSTMCGDCRQRSNPASWRVPAPDASGTGVEI